MFKLIEQIFSVWSLQFEEFSSKDREVHLKSWDGILFDCDTIYNED